MEIRPLTEGLSVGPQIAPSDVAELKSRGFRSLVCNRPDGESEYQPPFADIEAAARAAGLMARHIPVTAPIARTAVGQFREAIQTLPAPIFAFCRTGTRSAALWAMEEMDKTGHDASPHRVRRAGSDLTGLALPARGGD